MVEKDFSHRTVPQKLGVKQGQAVAIDDRLGLVSRELQQEIAVELGRSLATAEEPLDVVLTTLTIDDDPIGVLLDWKGRLRPAGGIWLMTPKKGRPGYINQTDLIPAGQAAGLVDNKICSVSDTLSAMRFVLRKVDRPKR